MKNLLPTLLRLPLTLLCFLAFAATSFGVIYRLDEDIKPDADGVYNVPVNSEFLIELVGHSGLSESVGDARRYSRDDALYYQFSSIDGSNVIYRRGSGGFSDQELLEGKTVFVQESIYYEFFFEAKEVDEANPVRTIIFSDNQGQSISKKIRVTDSEPIYYLYNPEKVRHLNRDGVYTYDMPNDDSCIRVDKWPNMSSRRSSEPRAPHPPLLPQQKPLWDN